MAAEHFPEPWRVVDGARFADGTRNTQTLEASNGSVVAEILMWDSEGLAEECNANAELLRAAPETAAERDRLRALNARLVEALEEALSEMETVDQNLRDGRETYISGTRIDIARAALAAAREEAN